MHFITAILILENEDDGEEKKVGNDQGMDVVE